MLFAGTIETDGIVNRMLDALLATISSQVGVSGSPLRRQIGDVRAKYKKMVLAGTFPAQLLLCFMMAAEADVKLSSLAQVRTQLFSETPVFPVNQMIVQAGIVFCLSTEATLVGEIEFVSRDGVEATMAAMKVAFDAARDLASDSPDLSAYQALTKLAGAVTQQLANSARPLPRMVSFILPWSFPSLVVSQRVYYSAERSEELIAENKIPHPAFCPRELRGLSA